MTSVLVSTLVQQPLVRTLLESFVLSILLFSSAPFSDEPLSAAELRRRQSTGNGEGPSENIQEHKSTLQTHLLKIALLVK